MLLKCLIAVCILFIFYIHQTEKHKKGYIDHHISIGFSGMVPNCMYCVHITLKQCRTTLGTLSVLLRLIMLSGGHNCKKEFLGRVGVSNFWPSHLTRKIFWWNNSRFCGCFRHLHSTLLPPRLLRLDWHVRDTCNGTQNWPVYPLWLVVLVVVPMA